MFGMFMPMGLLAIADYSSQNGYKTQVLHLGVEKINNHRFSIVEYVKEASPKVIGMSLHWHQQSYDVIETARRIKLDNPGVFIVLGGLTCSFFYQDIMTNFDWIDGVIRGDGEIPFLKLTQELFKDNRDLGSIPNLSWRDAGRISTNEASFVAQSHDLNNFNFTNFGLLKNRKLCTEYIKIPWFWINGFNKWMNYRFTQIKKVFPLPMFRGCPVDCSFCGGSKSSQELIYGRKDVAVRSIDKAIESIKEAKRYGYEVIFIEHLCLDQREIYFKSLFNKIKDEGIEISCIMECGPLPSREVIKIFKDTFSESHSMILLTPESASEKIRKLNKGFYFSNDELMETLQYMRSLKIPAELCFALGLPWETTSDIEETKKFQRVLKNKFKQYVTMRTQIIELDPGSLMYTNPQNYNIVNEKKYFLDFYYENKNWKNSPPLVKLGYYHCIPDTKQKVNIKNGLNPLEKELDAFMCRYFCRIANLIETNNIFFEKLISFLSKLFCRFVHFYWIATNFKNE